MVGSMSLPNRQKQHRIWLLAGAAAGWGCPVSRRHGSLVAARAPDLYVHLIWSWEVMRCLASGQLPVWLPDLNAGFGSPESGSTALSVRFSLVASASCSGKPAAACGPRRSWQQGQSCSCPVSVVRRLQARNTHGPV